MNYAAPGELEPPRELAALGIAGMLGACVGAMPLQV